MPCLDYEGRDYSRENDLRMQNDRLARMLCVMCTEYDHRGIKIPTGVAAWWERHKKADALAMEAARQNRIKEQKIQKALAKLTEEDKKLLRVK